MDKIKNGADEIYLAPETETSEDLALDEPIEEIENEDIPVMVEAEPKKNVRVGEILDLRENNRKVFLMSDGTEQAVFYPETVHVFNDDTKTFDDVDNTIVEEEDGRHYVSGKNHFIAKFSKEEENDELFSIESDMHRVTVSAKKNKKHKNHGVKPHIHKKDVEGFERTDMVVFEGVHDGADYEYSVTGNGVKENIVVKEKADVYRYPFVLHMENVTAKFDESNNRVAFISNENGEEVFFIPAPFMTDANGIISTAVSYELKNTANGDAVLTVTPDSEWMNAEERAFPVVIDPQIQLSSTSAMNTYSWDNGNLYSASLHTVGTTGCGDGTCNAKRMYMSFNMPTLPRNPRIKKAELKFFQASGASECGEYPKLGLYRVTEDICTGNCTPYHNSDLIDFAKMRIGHCEDDDIISYTFDVTTLVDQVNKGEVGVKNLVLKMIDETSECDNSITLYGSAYNSTKYVPQFIVTYESTYGVNTSYRTHTHELGRFGQGSIDLQCGNLMFESEDFAWAGNRMPVTIKHLYNSALSAYQYTENSTIKLSTANFSAMKVGNGFKLNIMQSMTYVKELPIVWTEEELKNEKMQHDGYVYIGENGEEAYFKMSLEQVCCDSNSQCYNLYEDAISGDMLYDPVKLTLKQGEDTYQFDSMGRLVQIKDVAGNHMDITYTSNRITSVTDGAGRDFSFAYNSNGFLTSITAPDETSILYTYSGNLLSTITYQDGKKVTFTYSSIKPTAVTLLDANGNNVYKVAYSYSGNLLYSVTEYGVENGAFVQGARSTYSYSVASGRTIVQTTEQMDAEEGECYDNVIKTVYTFDDEGNIVSEYVYSEDTGNTGVEGEESGIHPHSGDGGAGVVSNINNLLLGHNFENLNNWYGMACNCGDLNISNYANQNYTKYGKKLLRMQSNTVDCTENGVYQVTNTLPAGEYTFSAYMRVVSAFSGPEDKGAYIRVTTTDNKVLAESEHIYEKDSEFIRLTSSFVLETVQSVKVQLLVSGRGTVYFDAPQLENNPYANAYNMLENGNFELGTGWTRNGAYYTSGTRFNMSRSMYITGNVELNRNAYQRVYVKTNRTTRETFTLSGWAKGYGLPNHEDGIKPTFRLRAKIKYYDSYYGEYGTEEYTADFSPCTEEWQLASVQFAKSKYRNVDYIDVYLEYDHNFGTAYFDDIQLVRNSIETNLSAEDFETEPEEETTETTETTVTEAETETAEDDNGFKELFDDYGNALTETTFTDGEFGTIYRAFGFNVDLDESGNAGNDLIRETDARGNTTEYTVDEDTSRNEEVTDRCGNKTAYEYDESGRTTKVTSKIYEIETEEQKNPTVSYAYDVFDNLTQIDRGDGLDYVLKYNAFHNLESIVINGKTDGDLIKYTYKNGNGRLKEMTYANGDKMTATYNGIGQMIAEKWYNSSNELNAYYKYVYDGQGNIVRSIDIFGGKVYNYLYEDGKIMQSSESDIELDANEIITSKTFVCTVRYYYDAEDNLIRKRIKFADGKEHTVLYEQAENDSQIARFTAGDKMVTSHSKTDSFGRKVFDELQLGAGFISRQFHYLEGEFTDEHKNNDMLKSTPTTQLISQIVLSGNRTISYEYDEEERITKVDDSVDGITTYTYDALGQLLTETVNGTVVNSMEYDNYGNIKFKNGIKYSYDSVWKDKLTAVGDSTITYDAQGNPTSYLGNTLTWEKGRQLKSFGSNTYTYNAKGIRTSKTVDGIRHNFVLDGAIILKETWGSNTLIPLYDNEESVCGIIYNGTPYYFLKNQQGDVIVITDSKGDEVAKYSYDAWGKVLSVKDTDDAEITSESHIANINPFRYRSYYYDIETGLYYLQSRYYDADTGRFLNGDDATQIISDESTFEYCYNSPINFYDNFGYKPGQLFSKSSLAALDFAKLYYNISLYIRFEMSSVIYAIRKNSKIKYSYTNYIIGNPHNCRPLDGKKFIPKGAWVIGAIHTHPNSNIFSYADKEFAKYHYIALYVVTPNKNVRVFHDTRKGFRDELVKKNMVFSPLSQPLKNELIKIYRLRWLNHIRSNCDFNCFKKRWPTW